MNNIYIYIIYIYIYCTHILTIQVRTGQFWRVSNPFLPLATWEGHDCIPLKKTRENDLKTLRICLESNPQLVTVKCVKLAQQVSFHLGLPSFTNFRASKSAHRVAAVDNEARFIAQRCWKMHYKTRKKLRIKDRGSRSRIHGLSCTCLVSHVF